MQIWPDEAGLGGGGRRGEARPTGLIEGKGEAGKNQPNYPSELLFCRLLPVRLKCRNFAIADSDRKVALDPVESELEE